MNVAYNCKLTIAPRGRLVLNGADGNNTSTIDGTIELGYDGDPLNVDYNFTTADPLNFTGGTIDVASGASFGVNQ